MTDELSRFSARWPKASRRAKPAKAGKTVKKTAKKTAKASKRKPAKEIGRTPPRFIEPQLATLVSQPPSGDNWVHEIKYDGYRALCRISNGAVKLLTRSNNDWTKKFQSIADQMADLPIANAILDGEITSSEMSGATSFEALQQALSNNAQDRLHYYLFDALYLHGVDLRRRTLLERKEALRAVIPGKHPHLHFSEHFKGTGNDILAQACRIGLEGIISKRADAIYRSGRTEAWLKEKCTNEQEFVIGGFTYQPKHPERLAALLIGVYEYKELIFAGKVGTGFDRAESARLVKCSSRLRKRRHPSSRSPIRRAAARSGSSPNSSHRSILRNGPAEIRCGILRIRGCARTSRPSRSSARRKETEPEGSGAHQICRLGLRRALSASK
jgi:bifunctional non-homologous end joining protein LigD